MDRFVWTEHANDKRFKRLYAKNVHVDSQRLPVTELKLMVFVSMLTEYKVVK